MPDNPLNTAVNRQVRSSVDADIEIGDVVLVFRENKIEEVFLVFREDQSRWSGPDIFLDLNEKNVKINYNDSLFQFSFHWCGPDMERPKSA